MFKRIFSTYRQNQDLINIGAYTIGTDVEIDEAIALYPRLLTLIKQDMDQAVNWQQSLANLKLAIQEPIPNNRAASPTTINQQAKRF